MLRIARYARIGLLGTLTACAAMTPRAGGAPRSDTEEPPAIAAPEGITPVARDVRTLGYAIERCRERGASDLWDALVPLAPGFFVDDRADWVPGECAFFVPEVGAVPRVRGAMFADLDGDGHEEAITEVEYTRVRPPQQSHDPPHRARALLIVRTQVGVERPQISVLVSEDDLPEEDGVFLEGFDGARVENGKVVVVGTAGCYECGCDSVAFEYDCHSGACVYAGQRSIERVEPCDSP